MANIVGVLIIPLFVFTGLHYAQGGSYKLELAIFGVGHGYLYIVYLSWPGSWPSRRACTCRGSCLMFAAGLVPGLTFLVGVDHRDQEDPSPHGGPTGRRCRASRRGQPSRSMTVPLAWPPPSHIVW